MNKNTSIAIVVVIFLIAALVAYFNEIKVDNDG